MQIFSGRKHRPVKFESKFLLTLFFILIAVVSFSQENQIIQDPQAGQILERVAAKTKSLSTMQTNFDLVVEDRKEKTKNSSSGNLIMKKNKYKLNSEGSTVFFDGTTMWTYAPANNEVTITEPKANSTDFMTNPGTFFNSYKNDFKYRYVAETIKNGITCHEIDLFPKNLNQPYSRIKVFINKSNDLPATISSIGKDGVDYTVNLKNIVLNQEIGDATFVFDPSKYKKVEIVDMRGL